MRPAYKYRTVYSLNRNNVCVYLSKRLCGGSICWSRTATYPGSLFSAASADNSYLSSRTSFEANAA